MAALKAITGPLLVSLSLILLQSRAEAQGNRQGMFPFQLALTAFQTLQALGMACSIPESERMYKFQSGFRTSHFTDTCLLYLSDHIKHEVDADKCCSMSILDLQKAFDTVNHSILVNKLKAIDFDSTSVTWMKSYLEGREQMIETQVSGRASMNLGQQREAWKPLAHISANLSEVRSYRSTFLFRTFDPEGTVFYGDTKGGEDWFVLSLYGGVPLMEFSKENMQVSARGGPKINDGQWHQLGLTSQGKFVFLEVNGSKVLEVGMDTKEAHEHMAGQLRMAVGGILTDTWRLIVPLHPAMDACVKEGNWLNLNTPWETEEEELWPCYQNIRPGSYFTGNGFAVYNTSVFLIEEEATEVKIEIWGDFSRMDGTILSMRALGQVLTLEANDTKSQLQDITLTFGEDELLTAVTFNRLAIIFQKDSLQLLTYENPTEPERGSIITESLPGYLAMWREGRFAIGGLLGEGYVGSNYVRGCLEKIQIDGKDLDLDSAVKHASVSSYSCPA